MRSFDCSSCVTPRQSVIEIVRGVVWGPPPLNSASGYILQQAAWGKCYRYHISHKTRSRSRSRSRTGATTAPQPLLTSFYFFSSKPALLIVLTVLAISCEFKHLCPVYLCLLLMHINRCSEAVGIHCMHRGCVLFQVLRRKRKSMRMNVGGVI